MAGRYRIEWDSKWKLLAEASSHDSPEKFGGAGFAVRKRSVRGANRKTVEDVAKKIAELAQSYADAEPNPDGDIRIGGGLRSRGAGGAPRSAYPFRKSQHSSTPKRGGKIYRNSFTHERIIVDGARYASVGNTSIFARAVEYGSLGAEREARAISGLFRQQNLAFEGGFRKSRPSNRNKYRKSYYRIPLKRAAYDAMVARTKYLTYSERIARDHASVQPQYKAWQRYKSAVAKGTTKRVSHTYKNKFGTTVTRTRTRKIANIRKVARPTAIRGRLTERRMFLSDKIGGPAVFVRNFDGYGGYAILQRAIRDGARMYLK